MAKKESDFYNEHCVCPKCGGNDFNGMKFSMLDFDEVDFYDSFSFVKCKKCGWQGKVEKLKPKKC